MQTQVTQTNTTLASATLAHADIVRVLGLAVAVDAGLRSDQPGTTIKAELAPAEADGEFTATISVLIDHNYVTPDAASQSGQGTSDGAGTGAASLNSDGGQPVIPATTAPQGAAAVATGIQIPAGLGGLQIPGAPNT